MSLKPVLKKRKLNETALVHEFLSDDINEKDDNASVEADEEEEKEPEPEPEADVETDLPIASSDWSSLDLNPNTLCALHANEFDSMMRVQELCIPHLLLGENLVVSAETGSGKTLAFLIPMIERMLLFNWDENMYAESGVGSLIINPTRELAIQTRQNCLNLCQFHPILSVGLLIGGNPKHSDVIFITRGMTICICTPGRLLDHLINTKQFNCRNVKILIIDEADRILDQGYEQEMNLIFNYLPNKQRQTMLFSATQTRKTKDLIRLSFTTKPLFINLNLNLNMNSHTTPQHLEQGYLIVPAQQKFLLLFSFLKRMRNEAKKILVFCSTVAVTKYFVSLLNYIDIQVFGLYGSMSQSQRTNSFNSFSTSKSKFAVLIATNIAARGLDFENVDWILQFDPSNDIKNYIHRVGRTCRGITNTNTNNTNKSGKALLFLMPQEKKYLKVLKKANVNINKYQLPTKNKIAHIQTQLEKITSSVYHLHVLAHQAYQAYIREYALRNSNVFDVLDLNIIHLANMFGLNLPPKMTVETITKLHQQNGNGKHKNKNKHKQKGKFQRKSRSHTSKEYKSVVMRLPVNKWAKQKAPHFVL